MHIRLILPCCPHSLASHRLRSYASALFPADDSRRNVTYTTHYANNKKDFRLARISNPKVTHAWRVFAARNADASG